MTDRVGTGYVPIKPDTDGFGRELERGLDREGTPAAGRGGDDQGNLTKARARQAIADATLKELQYRREIRDVIAVAELEPSLITWIVGIRSAVENLAARLVALIESKHGIEIDTADVDDLVCTALDAIADYPRFSEDAACKAEPACAQASADADAVMAA